jgi:hypothetical protein
LADSTVVSFYNTRLCLQLLIHHQILLHATLLQTFVIDLINFMGYSWRVTSSSISQLTLPMALHDTLRQYGGSSPHAAATGNGPTCHHTIARPLQATCVCASVAVVVRRFCKVALRLCSSARSCVVFWCVASRHAGQPFSLLLTPVQMPNAKCQVSLSQRHSNTADYSNSSLRAS